jgi:hypothetical protein
MGHGERVGWSVSIRPAVPSKISISRLACSKEFEEIPESRFQGSLHPENEPLASLLVRQLMP